MLSQNYFETWGSGAEAQLWAGECFFGPRLQGKYFKLKKNYPQQSLS
jgi:hypothetical protein